MPRKIKAPDKDGQQPYYAFIPYNALMRVRKLGTEAEKVWLALLWQTCVRRRKTAFMLDQGVRTSVKQLAEWSGLLGPSVDRALKVLIKEGVLDKQHVPKTPARGIGAEFIFRLDFEMEWNAFFYDPTTRTPPGPSRGEEAGRFPKVWHYLKNVTREKYARIAKLGASALTVWLAIRVGKDSGTKALKEDPYYHITRVKVPVTTERGIADGLRALRKHIRENKKATA